MADHQRDSRDLDPQRVARLRALGLLDTPPEPMFDAIAHMAAAICETPIALISLVDEDRQWFKANVGLTGVSQTPREVSFCSHVIEGDGLMEVADASADSQFMHNPLVTGEPGIRFYAGVPLSLAGGWRMGTVCVIDRRPRRLDERQRRLLCELANVASNALLLRDAAVLSSAEAGLLESERKFRALSDSSPFGVYHTDPAGLCTYTNDRWRAVFGLSLAQSLGDGWSHGLHEDDRAAVFEQWQHTARTGEDFEGEFRVRRRSSGDVRHVRSRARALRDATGLITGFVGAVEDITDRVAAQARQREVETLLDRAGRLAGVGGWRLDLEQSQVFWSDETCRIHDVAPGHRPSLEEATGYYAGEAKERIVSLVASAVDHGIPFDVELPLVTATGRRIWVRSIGEAASQNGRGVSLFGAIQDVTARRTLEQGLATANDQLRQLYEQTPSLMASIDASGCILSVSDLLATRCGRRRDELVGTPLSALIHEEDRLASGIEQLFASGRCERVPYRMAGARGELRVFMSAILERGPGAGPVRAMVVFEDVTETVARTEELTREHTLRLQIERHVEEHHFGTPCFP